MAYRRSRSRSRSRRRRSFKARGIRSQKIGYRM